MIDCALITGPACVRDIVLENNALLKRSDSLVIEMKDLTKPFLENGTFWLKKPITKYNFIEKKHNSNNNNEFGYDKKDFRQFIKDSLIFEAEICGILRLDDYITHISESLSWPHDKAIKLLFDLIVELQIDFTYVKSVQLTFQYKETFHFYWKNRLLEKTGLFPVESKEEEDCIAIKFFLEAVRQAKSSQSSNNNNEKIISNPTKIMLALLNSLGDYCVDNQERLSQLSPQFKRQYVKELEEAIEEICENGFQEDIKNYLTKISQGLQIQFAFERGPETHEEDSIHYRASVCNACKII